MRKDRSLIHRFLRTHPDLFDDAAALRLEPDEQGHQTLALSGLTVWMFCDWLFEQGYRSQGREIFERFLDKIAASGETLLAFRLAHSVPEQAIKRIIATLTQQEGSAAGRGGDLRQGEGSD